MSTPTGGSPDDTPLMRQWHDVKARNQDALVFFRVGDFYELFNDDAREGARLLGLTLTSRNNGGASRVPLAGIPVKALDDYLARLVSVGRRVAICEQVEDPSEAKGIVRREVVETVTPGTVMADTLLQARVNNFLLALASEGDGAYGMAALDLSTGEFILQQVEPGALEAELGRWGPSEILISESLASTLDLPGEGGSRSPPLTVREDWIFRLDTARDELLRRFGVISLEGLGFHEDDGGLVAAAGGLLGYVGQIQPAGVEHLRHPVIQRPGFSMLLDEMTRRNLELIHPLRTDAEGGTLICVVDRTVTAMGGRLLRRWVLGPLVVPEAIWRRLDGVEALVERPRHRREVRGFLGEMADLERLAGKVGSGRASPRELLALARSLGQLPRLQDAVADVPAALLAEQVMEMDLLEDVHSLLDGAISSQAPATLQEGGVIREGFSDELDELRALRDGAREFIASLQTRERERTGIPSLKVGFNKVFGYYLEVTRAKLEKVPDGYIRKQTLSNAERFFTPELKEWEEKVMGAEERILELETQLFQRLRQQVGEHLNRIQVAAGAVAILDVLSALAELAQDQGYVRPEIHTGSELEIRAGRHPVVETMMPRESFIPNDLVLDDQGRIVILTGPNMAGKSTVLRQVGLIQLLGQMGSFVPAHKARLPVCDRIFTRVGASDNLARGQSTFMVEMHETSSILHGATSTSLVLLDEIGRGTSTYDGVSIAWAVTEHLHREVGCKTIFATHYHELTRLGDLLEGVKNMNVSVKESGDDVLFLRRLVDGGADRSYGIQVARLAGLPPEVVERAKELLVQLEGSHARDGEVGPAFSGDKDPVGHRRALSQLSLFRAENHPVLERLKQMDVLNLTPLEALNLLSELRSTLEGE
ncbi:MAG: DNA mismatch repair protein MutS [Gemmatimonadota bacterium]